MLLITSRLRMNTSAVRRKSIQLKVLGFLCLYLFFGFTLHAATVRGYVFNSDNEPLPGVVIRIDESSLWAISAQDGSYVIGDIPSGTYQLNITCIGFQDIKQEIVIDGDKTVVEANLTLEESTTDLDAIVVRGQSMKDEIESKGFAVEVIETEKASLQSIQTNDLLNRTAGVRVRQNGGIGSRVDYNLNGMSGNSVRIFIDGLPISTYGASFSLNSIPPGLIERIEVYKGVLPAHLADDALGGAINVILKKGIKSSIATSVSYGSFNTLQANLNAVHRSASSGFTAKLSAFYNYSDNDYEVWGKFVRNILPNGRYDFVRARRFNDAYKSLGGKIDIGFTGVKWADQFFISYTGSDDYNEIQHGTYMSIPYQGRFTTSQSNVFGLTYSRENVIIPGLDITFNGSISKRAQVVNDTVPWNYNWFGERSIGLNGNPILRPQGAQQGAPTINHIDRNVGTFRAGANFTISPQQKIIFTQTYFNIDRFQQDFKRSAVERDFIGTRDLQKTISSLGYEFNLWKSRFKGNLYGKYYVQKIDRMDPVLVEENGSPIRVEDRVSSTKSTTGFGTAYSFSLSQRIMILASAEQAVRMPSEGEVFGSPGENIVENLSIRPEISNNFNLGFQAGSFNHKEHSFSFSVTGFIRDTRDKIIQRINPRINDAVQTNPFENLGKSKAIGFEGQVNYNYSDRLNTMINFSRFNSVFNTKYDPNGNIYDNYNQQIPNEPYFTINSSIEYTLENVFREGNSMRLTYNFGFVERFYTTWLEIEDFRTPRQFFQDFGATYSLPVAGLSISADVRNIFDRQVYDNFAVQKPGRAFYMKINYSLDNI